MKKRVRFNWKSYMVQPAFYKGITKFVIVLTIAFLWDRFLKRNGLMLVRDGFFVAGAVFVALSWFHYLKLDGVDVFGFQADSEKKKTRHVAKGMADYVDQHIVAWEELSWEERQICGFVSDLVLAVLFLVPALVMHVF